VKKFNEARVNGGSNYDSNFDFQLAFLLFLWVFFYGRKFRGSGGASSDAVGPVSGNCGFFVIQYSWMKQAGVLSQSVPSRGRTEFCTRIEMLLIHSTQPQIEKLPRGICLTHVKILTTTHADTIIYDTAVEGLSLYLRKNDNPRTFGKR
jgi:hypothetical protein